MHASSAKQTSPLQVVKIAMLHGAFAITPSTFIASRTFHIHIRTLPPPYSILFSFSFFSILALVFSFLFFFALYLNSSISNSKLFLSSPDYVLSNTFSLSKDVGSRLERSVRSTTPNGNSTSMVVETSHTIFLLPTHSRRIHPYSKRWPCGRVCKVL